jgi:toxin-antitoxin system, toxin component, fic family
MEKAEREFNMYRQREMAQLESDFDKMVKQLPKRGESLAKE